MWCGSWWQCGRGVVGDRDGNLAYSGGEIGRYMLALRIQGQIT